MLVLLSFGLVLVATVLLVLGLLVGDGLALIYLSITLSATAAIILFVAVRVSKPNAALAGGPAPLTPEPELARVGALGAEATATMPAAAPAPAPVPPTPAARPRAPVATPTAVEADADAEWLAADQEWEEAETEWDGEIAFPIADYDELTVDEILPLLPQLYTDELDVVEEREVAGRNRVAIVSELRRLRAEAMGDAAEDDGGEASEAAFEPEVTFEVDADLDEDDAGFEPLPADEEDEFFPIEDYEVLEVGEIIELLGELDDEELAEVRAREAATHNRQTIIQNIDRRLSPPSRPGSKRAPLQAKKAAPAAKKAAAPGKRATAKKAAPAEQAAPARKPTAKRTASAAKDPTAKKAPAPARKATKKG